MCLDRLYNPKVKTFGVGYHVALGDSILYPTLADISLLPIPLTINKWMHEGAYRAPKHKHKKMIRGSNKYGGMQLFEPVKYPFGWHIFENQEQASDFLSDLGDTFYFTKKYSLHRVRYRSAVAWGGQLVWINQGDHATLAPIVVAKEMLILND